MRENVYIGHVQKSQIGGYFHCIYNIEVYEH